MARNGLAEKDQVQPKTSIHSVPEPKPARVSERVTVNLSKPSSEALEATVELTGNTKTEVINKALQLYKLVQEAQSKGGALWIQDDQDADVVRSRFY